MGQIILLNYCTSWTETQKERKKKAPYRKMTNKFNPFTSINSIKSFKIKQGNRKLENDMQKLKNTKNKRKE